jgi:phosphogluconate dehydratase
MSGASGKVPAAIHMVPEAKDGGAIGKIQTGDLIRLNAHTGQLDCLVEDFLSRQARSKDINQQGFGRELFNNLRQQVTTSEEGASFIL